MSNAPKEPQKQTAKCGEKAVVVEEMLIASVIKLTLPLCLTDTHTLHPPGWKRSALVPFKLTRQMSFMEPIGKTVKVKMLQTNTFLSTSVQHGAVWFRIRLSDPQM